MDIATGDEMAAIDAEAIEGCGLPEAALMERAGFEVAKAVRGHCGGEPRRAAIVCGGGKNGGDGFVAARALANWGFDARVHLLAPPKGEPAASFFSVLERMGIPVALDESGSAPSLDQLREADIVVDAMLGTGLKGPLRPAYARAVAAINEARRPVVAVDIPTGVRSEDGAVLGDAVAADVTIAFTLPKLGHLLGRGRECSGRLKVVDIGVPRGLYVGRTGRVWVRRELAQSWLRPRPMRAHKGVFGSLLVVAGSFGMAGAAALAAKGALRSGVGRVVWAGPKCALPVVQTLVPEATAIGLAEEDGALASSAVERLLAEADRMDAAVIGPGLGWKPHAAEAIRQFVGRAGAPVVIDADGLNALSELESFPWRDGAPRVLTPHPKEAARLLRISTNEVTQDPIGAARRIAERFRAVCVLKGSPTVSLEPHGPVHVNGSGDVSLATAGSGDVLAGVIGALLAQGYPIGQSAALGAYVHGLAGELAGRRLGSRAALASDAANALSDAFLRLEGGEGGASVD